ncbi:hypothetical protein M758_3G136500 [Ceratodon purpureus]|nr:hypothetical protein M758_3G136500 [Ceratodon purpureus]
MYIVVGHDELSFLRLSTILIQMCTYQTNTGSLPHVVRSDRAGGCFMYNSMCMNLLHSTPGNALIMRLFSCVTATKESLCFRITSTYLLLEFMVYHCLRSRRGALIRAAMNCFISETLAILNKSSQTDDLLH